MPGRAAAVHSRVELRDRVVELGRQLGLDARTEVRVARRLWASGPLHRRGADAQRHGQNARRRVQVQGGGGSAEEKVPATIQDIAAWPIPGIVVFGGDGFSTNMVAYFHSTGKAVAIDELEPKYASKFCTEARNG